MLGFPVEVDNASATAQSERVLLRLMLTCPPGAKSNEMHLLPKAIGDVPLPPDDSTLFVMGPGVRIPFTGAI